MLTITVPASKKMELWNEKTQEFVYIPSHEAQILKLEHSLLSISKWEAKWGKPFLKNRKKTVDETIDYFRCMTLDENVPSDVYLRLSDENVRAINEYMKLPMTATTFGKEKAKQQQNNSDVTAEIIYYWMISLGIPFECQTWHLNRLLALIRVCDIKNRPPKKISREEIMRRNTSRNAARRKKYNTRG